MASFLQQHGNIFNWNFTSLYLQASHYVFKLKCMFLPQTNNLPTPQKGFQQVLNKITATTHFSCFHAEKSLLLRSPGPWMMMASECFNYEIGNLSRFQEANDKNKLLWNRDWGEMKGVHRVVNSKASINYYANIVRWVLCRWENLAHSEATGGDTVIYEIVFSLALDQSCMQMQSSLDGFEVGMQRLLEHSQLWNREKLINFRRTLEITKALARAKLSVSRERKCFKFDPRQWPLFLKPGPFSWSGPENSFKRAGLLWWNKQ